MTDPALRQGARADRRRADAAAGDDPAHAVAGGLPADHLEACCNQVAVDSVADRFRVTRDPRPGRRARARAASWSRSGSAVQYGRSASSRRTRRGRSRPPRSANRGTGTPPRLAAAAHRRARRRLPATGRSTSWPRSTRSRSRRRDTVARPGARATSPSSTRRFAELRRRPTSKPRSTSTPRTAVMPELLSAALRSWITEVGNDDMEWETEPVPDGKPVVHAGLRRTLDEERDIEERWTFRAIAARHGISALHRLRDARSAAGDAGRRGQPAPDVAPQRPTVSKGTKTQAELGELAAAGEPAVSRSPGRRPDVQRAAGRCSPGRATSCRMARGPQTGEPHRRFLREVPARTPRRCAGSRSRRETRPPDRPPTEPVDHPGRGQRRRLGGPHRAGVAAQARGDLRRLGVRQDRAACGGSSRSARCAGCPRSCWTRTTTWPGSASAWPEPPAAWRPGDARTARRVPGQHRRRGVDAGPCRWPAAELPPAAGLRRCARRSGRVHRAVEAAVAALAPHARVAGGDRRPRVAQQGGAARGADLLRTHRVAQPDRLHRRARRPARTG